MRALIGNLSLLCLTALPLEGQQRDTTARLPDTRRVCDMPLRLVLLRLLDAAGVPVSGATLTVVRRRGRVPVAGAGAMGGQGDYKVLEDGDVRDLAPDGERFDAAFRRDGRTRRVRLVIGTDSARCHVRLISPASTTIRF